MAKGELLCRGNRDGISSAMFCIDFECVIIVTSRRVVWVAFIVEAVHDVGLGSFGEFTTRLEVNDSGVCEQFKNVSGFISAGMCR